VVLDADGRPRIADLPEPELPVEVLACGLCGSDVEKLGRGPAGTVLGHEVVVPDGARRLALVHHRPCGECERCRSGHESTCDVFAAATIVGPLVVADRLYDFDANVAYGFSALMLPALVVVGLFASPTFEAWALRLRGGRRAGWSSDDASAHRAVWLIEGLWAALVFVLLDHHRMHALGSDETLALAWTASMALTLPLYFLFASTRYATVGARWAFGVAVAAHRMAIAHAKQRSTFGAPLAQRQAIQWMLADAEVEIRAARWLIWEGAWKADRGEDARVEASIAKLYSSEVLGRVIDAAVQIHGGYGVSKEFPLERWYREARVRRIGEGPSEVHRMVIARSLFR